jgi:hypothetical protein
MYYSYVEIEYVATSLPPARMDLAVKLFKGRRLVVFRRRRHCVNQNAGTIQCCGRSLISVREMETFNQIGSKARLIEVDSDGRRGNLPGEVDPQKPVHNPDEVNLASFC